MPIVAASDRRIRAHRPWKVAVVISRACLGIRIASRSVISRAALLVNERQSMERGSNPRSMALAARSVIVFVLPVPTGAMTRTARS